MKESWNDVRVLILGLGQYPKGSGISAALFAARNGADVLVTDQKSEKDLSANVRRLKKFRNVRFRLGAHDLADVRWADVILRNPRVRHDSPEMRLAARLGKTVESDVSLFLKRCPASVIGITGTRGKSTTSALVAEMLRTFGKRVWLGGNILVSPLTFLSKVKPSDVVVLELSSWQLEVTGAAGISPHIACVTNLMRDHLNTYPGMEEYAEAKAQIFRHQTEQDVVVLNGDDAYGRQWARETPSQVHIFSKKQLSSFRQEFPLRLPGDHNALNALAASTVAFAAGATKVAIRKALRGFTGLPHRQEVVAVRGGMTYVNDTTATTPDGTIAALRTFRKRGSRIHIIIGGADKELEFDDLATELRKAHAHVIVLPGTAHAKLTRAFGRRNVPFEDASDLRSAVMRCQRLAAKGDVIVLSPGCASFGLFKNEFDRGEQFRRLVRLTARKMLN